MLVVQFIIIFDFKGKKTSLKIKYNIISASSSVVEKKKSRLSDKKKMEALSQPSARNARTVGRNSKKAQEEAGRPVKPLNEEQTHIVKVLSHNDRPGQLEDGAHEEEAVRVREEYLRTTSEKLLKRREEMKKNPTDTIVKPRKFQLSFS